ncbi:MAG TPA: SCO family protein [Burkholderiaceae bacterium]|nr:SCO family protein [Burkholderiaceae bacterium]
MRAAFVLALPLFAQAQSVGAAANAEALAPKPDVPAISLTQRLGSVLPMAQTFTDSTGRALPLGAEFQDGQPVILVLGYLRCPQLCGLLMHGLLEALHEAGPPTAGAHIVFASIDPGDTPADAAIRRTVVRDYARFLDAGSASARQPRIDLLVGSRASIAALARSVGEVHIAASSEGSTPSAARYAHPAAIVVITPDGRVSRYLMGVRFEPAALRTALAEASRGGVGTFADRLALMCAHIDPHVGRWSLAVLEGMRALGIASLAAFALFVWLQRVRPGRKTR